ncbi:TAXI family TRAP transporter solute-binding subunit [Meridianimarinicoccus aquatilis]|uniref:TAXI family TRAP transporter solute-binding subunit n=1 Tax=Meridianimarinicoccus aquatilis TaxID=2552766 RepID=A0A4R6AZC4_9RHOB|nr:TAXI family TRAP transporter solute-binding subunit [Fluviibacterium aquatile]QIE42518.1 TAXI family TRAP transporter solute-binding subunit [Rhodobacteraceae bacterium SC52]TDL89134.1 TAXI family TRAP transporter solute-binding subunit [Fluviibacterium aquatile]
MFKTAKHVIGAVALATLGTAAVAEEMRIGTASLGGAFYPLGQSISNVVNAHAGGDLTMVPIVTGGSVQNPNLLAQGEVEIAITNNNLAVLAVAGKGPYKAAGPIDMSAVAALHPSVLHMMVLADSDIQTFEDLRGKRVAVGPAGGGTLGFLNFLLPLHDMGIDDITPSFVSYSDGFGQLTDGTVDATLALSGYPAGAVMQATAGADLRFIAFSEGMLDAALAQNSAFRAVEVAADVYGTAEPGTVIGVNNMLVALNSLDASAVEAITRAIFDNLDELRAENANARQIDPAMSLDLAIPLHPGAKAYFDVK